MHRAALVAMLLSGCDFAFRLDHVDPVAGDAVVSDVTDGASPTPCAPFFDEPFDTVVPGMECQLNGGGQASLDAGATMTQVDGHLIITPAASTPRNGGSCVTTMKVPFNPGGIMVEVSEVIHGQGSFTTLTIATDDLTLTTNNVDTAGNGRLVLQNAAGSLFYGSAPYTSAMRWWRMRPQDSLVVAESSTDGIDWVLVASHAVTPASPVSIGLHAGFGATAGSGRAVYERLVVCQ